LAEVEKRLAVATAKWDADPESEHWQAQVDKADKEKRALVKELKQAEALAANPQTAVWAEAIEMMKESEPERLRAALLETIDSIHCLFVPRGKRRVAAVQVWFRGEGQQRSYLILHQGANGGAVGKRPARCWCCSLADVDKLGPMDLRDRNKVLSRADKLAKMDLSWLTTDKYLLVLRNGEKQS
jgi:hypothetical protein